MYIFSVLRLRNHLSIIVTVKYQGAFSRPASNGKMKA
jgi:hypothetical protein